MIHDEEPDILIIEWKDGKATWGGIDFGCSCQSQYAMSRSYTALCRSPPERTLIAVRGGPYAELALQLGMSLNSKQLDVLHIDITGAKRTRLLKA